jgi:hypothetical protein
MSALDSVAGDFEPTAPSVLAIDLLVRGVSRRDIAAQLGVPLAIANNYVADGVRQRSGEAGTVREAFAVLQASLDDIQRRAYAEIDRDVETTAPLLEVLLGVQRLRAGLLAAPKRQGTQ